MTEFTKGEIYGGMMAGFAQAFGDALTDMPTGKASEVAFGSTQTWAGVPFEFRHGASTDFPGASILIGGKVYYTHWTPAKAHVSHLQISSAAAIDAEIAEAEKSLKSGAELFIGGHGGGICRGDEESISRSAWRSRPGRPGKRTLQITLNCPEVTLGYPQSGNRE